MQGHDSTSARGDLADRGYETYGCAHNPPEAVPGPGQLVPELPPEGTWVPQRKGLELVWTNTKSAPVIIRNGFGGRLTQLLHKGGREPTDLLC
jgi:hypothetical protein